jgi:Glycosyl hydrolase catalytic core
MYSSDPPPEELRYTHMKGLKIMTNITDTKSGPSPDETPLFSGPGFLITQGPAQLSAVMAASPGAPVEGAPVSFGSSSKNSFGGGGSSPGGSSAPIGGMTVPVGGSSSGAPVSGMTGTPAAPNPVSSPAQQLVASTGSPKKGFVVGNGDSTVGGQKVLALNSKWYYTWGPTPVANPPTGVPFTPMFWNWAKTPNAATVLSNLKTLNVAGQENILLAYNEPDGTNASAQGNMTVGSAVEYWPQLVATGRRLGSPVMYGSTLNPPSSPNTLNTPLPPGGSASVTITIGGKSVTLNPAIWLDNFLIQISQQNLKLPDFICIHSYTPPDATGFLNMLQGVYNKYGLPIWVTEYSVADWKATCCPTVHSPGDWSYPTSETITTNATAKFMSQTMAGMDQMPFVERYSWKERFLLSPVGTTPNSNNSVLGPDNPDVMGQSALFNSYEHFPTTMPPLTPLGQLYASH